MENCEEWVDCSESIDRNARTFSAPTVTAFSTLGIGSSILQDDLSSFHDFRFGPLSSYLTIGDLHGFKCPGVPLHLTAPVFAFYSVLLY